jgi:hypothetical protein
MDILAAKSNGTSDLRHLVLLSGAVPSNTDIPVQTYTAFTKKGRYSFINDNALRQAEADVSCEDLANLQFTSGKSKDSIQPVAFEPSD